MTQIFLQPAGNDEAQKHFETTIQNKISVAAIKEYLTDSECAELDQVYTQSEVAVWGVLPNKSKTYWEKMQINDLVFFTGNKRIFAYAFVAFKLKNPNKKLANKLWEITDDGQTWEYIYFLKDIQYTDVLFDKVQGFSRVKFQGNPYKKLLEKFPFLSDLPLKGTEVLNIAKVQKQVKDALEKEEKSLALVKDNLSDKETLNNIVSSIQRLEQPHIRTYLFGDKTEEICGICQQKFPVDMLIAAHIKKRSDCEREEQLDIEHIAMPMCKLGCDDLYEKGYIAVQNKSVVVNEQKAVTPILQTYLNGIKGKQINSKYDQSEEYFKYHYDKHFGDKK